MSSPAATRAERTLGLEPGSFPFESRFCRTGGAKVHYVDEGHGPTLFMVHGNPTWSFHLPPRGQRPSPTLPLCRDRPAGLRPVRAAGRFRVPPGRPCGHRRGPAGRARDRGRYPHRPRLGPADRARRGVCRAGAADPLRARQHLGLAGQRRLALRMVLALHGRAVRPLWRPALEPVRQRRDGVLDPRAPLAEEAKRAYRAPLRDPTQRTGTHVFPGAITKSGDFLRGIEVRLGELDECDFLFLWPDGDIAFRDAELRRWHSLHPAAQVIPLRKCGHYIFEEAGPECADALARWLAQDAPGKGVPAPSRLE